MVLWLFMLFKSARLGWISLIIRPRKNHQQENVITYGF